MLWEAVQALSPTRRAAPLLFYYRQQSVREVAAQVGISTAAVKVHLHTARKQCCCCAGTRGGSLCER
jgi:DNA-directed RNA polymerase specialized sigma24 family protein